MSESEAFAPTEPRCSASCWVRLRPVRVSDPAISQFVPAEVPVNAGRATERFSFPLTQKYEPPITRMITSTTTPMIRAIRRPCRPGCPQNRQRRPPPVGAPPWVEVP